jgi:hypothetical protein
MLKANKAIAASERVNRCMDAILFSGRGESREECRLVTPANGGRENVLARALRRGNVD